MMPTIKTLEEAARAANDKNRYRGLSKKEVEKQKDRVKIIRDLLAQALIRKMEGA